MMGHKILIIEDEPDVATYLATLLRTNGYEPEVVTDPNEAFEMLDKVAPELISLDIMMPEKSGLSMYSRLRNETAYKDIPVLIVSGVEAESQFDFRSYVKDESIPEPEHYFEKPIDVERYLSVIAKLLDPKVKSKQE